MKTNIKKYITEKYNSCDGSSTVVNFPYNGFKIKSVINKSKKTVTSITHNGLDKITETVNCNPNDEFNPVYGVELSLYRLMKKVVHNIKCEIHLESIAIENFNKDIERRFEHLF